MRHASSTRAARSLPFPCFNRGRDRGERSFDLEVMRDASARVSRIAFLERVTAAAEERQLSANTLIARTEGVEVTSMISL